MDIGAKEIAEGVAAALALLGVVAGIADWRHRRRHNLDKVSLFDWRTVQVFALIGAALTFFVIGRL